MAGYLVRMRNGENVKEVFLVKQDGGWKLWKPFYLELSEI
jgi:hypothetical protein